jgi:prevent-host-death family protein
VSAVSTITSRDFNQDVSAAKRTAATEPVIITDRGKPSHVLLSIEDYRRLVADRRSIVDWLSADDDIDLVTGRVDLSLATPDL